MRNKLTVLGLGAVMMMLSASSLAVRNPNNSILQEIQTELNNGSSQGGTATTKNATTSDDSAQTRQVAQQQSTLMNRQAAPTTKQTTHSFGDWTQGLLASKSAAPASEKQVAETSETTQAAGMTSPTTLSSQTVFQPAPIMASMSAQAVQAAARQKAFHSSARKGAGYRITQDAPSNKTPQGIGISPYPNNQAAERAVAAFQPSETEQDQLLRALAFKALLNHEVPLTPQQVIKLHSIFNQSQRAAATWPGVPPKPVSTSMQVKLAPGSTQPVIRLQAGFVSSLVFVDSTGAPWPIESYDLGNPKAFDVQWDKKSNLLMVQAKALYTYANMAVKLRGLQTPLMLMLVPGQQEFDYRVDLRVPGLGPNALALPMGNGLPSEANSSLLSLLDGIPPTGAKTLHISGSNTAQAWLSEGQLFLRTRMVVLSPGWLDKMSSADGMNAYQLQVTPTILVSRDGKLVKLTVEGF